jgi:hypothetical protein
MAGRHSMMEVSAHCFLLPYIQSVNEIKAPMKCLYRKSKRHMESVLRKKNWYGILIFNNGFFLCRFLLSKNVKMSQKNC